MARRQCKQKQAYFQGVACPLKDVTYHGMRVVAGKAGRGEIALGSLPDGSYVDYLGVPLRVDQHALRGRKGRAQLDGDAMLDQVARGTLTTQELAVISERLAAQAGKYQMGSSYRDQVANLLLASHPEMNHGIWAKHAQLVGTRTYLDWAATHPEEHDKVCQRLAGRLGSELYLPNNPAGPAVLALAQQLTASMGEATQEGQRLNVAQLGPGQRALLHTLAKAQGDRRLLDALPPELRARRLVRRIQHTVGYNQDCSDDLDEIAGLLLSGEVTPQQVVACGIEPRRFRDGHSTTRFNRELLSSLSDLTRATAAIQGPLPREQVAELVGTGKLRLVSGGNSVAVPAHEVGKLLAHRGWEPRAVIEELQRQERDALSRGTQPQKHHQMLWDAIGTFTQDENLRRELAGQGCAGAIRRLTDSPQDSELVRDLIRRGSRVAIANANPQEMDAVLTLLEEEGPSADRERGELRRDAVRAAARHRLTDTLRLLGRQHGSSFDDGSPGQREVTEALQAGLSCSRREWAQRCDGLMSTKFPEPLRKTVVLHVIKSLDEHLRDSTEVQRGRILEVARRGLTPFNNDPGGFDEYCVDVFPELFPNGSVPAATVAG